MDVRENDEALLRRAARSWGFHDQPMVVLRAGPNPTVHLPSADCVLRLHRAEVTVPRVVGVHRARAVLRDAGVPVVPLLEGADGAAWTMVDDRVVEAEAHVPHDGRMNAPDVLTRGAALLAQVHDAWRDLRLPVAAEACSWANWIAPEQVVDGVRAGVERVADATDLRSVCADAVRLAHLVGDEPADLPRQLVHGDFWDDNVYVRQGELVAVSDFDFLGRRPRVDDLALLLHFADEQPTFEGRTDRTADERVADLRPLVAAYCRSLTTPLTDAEHRALPLALARQPLWGFGGWVPRMRDDTRARDEVQRLAGPLRRALDVADDLERWRDGLLSA